jgi:osmotically-inducible protein OsmY
MSRTDEDLREAIERELEAEPGLDAAAIGVAVKDGTATLSGEVSSYTEKWQALKAAERVRGIRAVVDALVVRLPDDHTRSDTDIARAAAFALEWDSEVPEGVTATVEDGFITLHGEVENEYQREAAERAVRHLMGVRGIANLIRVTPSVPAGRS